MAMTKPNGTRNETERTPPEKEVVDGRRPQAFPPSIESKSQAESSKKRDKVDDLDDLDANLTRRFFAKRS